ncbi:MAG: hypothetical protein JXB48_15985 [Candidatus Latescibacteria bacterium]|nr:hypothetical protein [Candidatus Latescibacterota bacterium]
MPKWYGGSTLNPDELLSPKDQWIDQWDRLNRWYKRTQLIKVKSKNEELDSFDIDIIITFFQNCFHLKDWLLTSLPTLGQDVQNLFKNNIEMGACRDICHGFKHKKLSNPTYDADFNIYKEYDHFFVETPVSTTPIIYNIAFSYQDHIKKYEMFDFIENCYKIWKEFLENKKML